MPSGDACSLRVTCLLNILFWRKRSTAFDETRGRARWTRGPRGRGRGPAAGFRADIPRRAGAFLAKIPPRRNLEIPRAGRRGDAAAATWMFRGRVAATPRPRRGYSEGGRSKARAIPLGRWTASRSAASSSCFATSRSTVALRSRGDASGDSPAASSTMCSKFRQSPESPNSSRRSSRSRAESARTMPLPRSACSTWSHVSARPFLRSARSNASYNGFVSGPWRAGPAWPERYLIETGPWIETGRDDAAATTWGPRDAAATTWGSQRRRGDGEVAATVRSRRRRGDDADQDGSRRRRGDDVDHLGGSEQVAAPPRRRRLSSDPARIETGRGATAGIAAATRTDRKMSARRAVRFVPLHPQRRRDAPRDGP